MTDTAAIILAAGKSTRMKSDLPKVLHPVCGEPMLTYALDACRGAGIARLLVVVGHQHERVQRTFAGHELTWVHQAEQLGTGHAVLVCEPALDGFEGRVVVIAGDMPLVRSQTIRDLLDMHAAAGAALTLGTTELDDPAGYGRILRTPRGALSAIVEEADCTEDQRAIREVNPSYYCFDSKLLFETLHRIEPSGAKGEYYITAAVHILVADGRACATHPGLPAEEAMGVNSPEDLSRVEEVMRRRGAALQMP